jgi:hypothetical protein
MTEPPWTGGQGFRGSGGWWLVGWLSRKFLILQVEVEVRVSGSLVSIDDVVLKLSNEYIFI